MEVFMLVLPQKHLPLQMQCSRLFMVTPTLMGRMFNTCGAVSARVAGSLGIAFQQNF
jgi:hypothetical protein